LTLALKGFVIESQIPNLTHALFYHNSCKLDLNEQCKGTLTHSYDILGARMLWKPKEARILKNFIEF
jgi:hypothetical protein